MSRNAPETSPGDCEHCPAAQYGPGGVMPTRGFSAFTMPIIWGKPENQKPCSLVRNQCPREKGTIMEKEELELKAQLEKGSTIVVSKKRHPGLYRWLVNDERYVYIGRPESRPRELKPPPADFGNKFKVGRDGNRSEVCDKHEEYFRTNEELQRWIPFLRGKALICFCAPKRCHGDTLARAANGG